MRGLASIPSWVPEPFREDYERAGDPFIGGLAGAYRWWTGEKSPWSFILDDAGITDLLMIPGVSLEPVQPV